MSDEEITKALVQYRLLEDQKGELELKQSQLREQITKHMTAKGVENLESNGVVAQYVARTKYGFDIPGILAAVPQVIEHLKLSNEGYMKVLKGNEAKIGSLRQVISDEKSLTIRVKKPKAE
jgi:hypothetical protein